MYKATPQVQYFYNVLETLQNMAFMMYWHANAYKKTAMLKTAMNASVKKGAKICEKNRKKPTELHIYLE